MKAGELAIVVSCTDEEWIGRIVTLVRQVVGLGVPSGRAGEGWETDPAPLPQIGFLNYCLRPIRGDEGNEPFIKTVSVDDQINVLRRLNQRRKERA